MKERLEDCLKWIPGEVNLNQLKPQRLSVTQVLDVFLHTQNFRKFVVYNRRFRQLKRVSVAVHGFFKFIGISCKDAFLFEFRSTFGTIIRKQ